MRKEVRLHATHFVVYVLLQLLVLYKFSLFNSAFAFFYIAFLLFLPPKQSPIVTMSTGFLVGLLIDIFSNTPGIHASASVALSFLRYPWLVRLKGTPDELAIISVYSWGLNSFFVFIFPLAFLHHFLIFFLENGSFSDFGIVFRRVVYSSILSTLLIILSNYLIANKERRL